MFRLYLEATPVLKLKMISPFINLVCVSFKYIVLKYDEHNFQVSVNVARLGTEKNNVDVEILIVIVHRPTDLLSFLKFPRNIMGRTLYFMK